MNGLTIEQAKELREYLKENVKFFEMEIDLAMDKVWEHHSGLELELSNSFQDAIWDAVQEWCEENGIDVDEFYENNYLEDILLD